MSRRSLHVEPHGPLQIARHYIRELIYGANDGTFQNGASTIAEGKVDSALSFDGIDDYVQIADAPVLDFAGAFTLEAWINVPVGSHPNFLDIFDKSTATDRNYGLFVNPNVSPPVGVTPGVLFSAVSLVGGGSVTVQGTTPLAAEVVPGAVRVLGKV